MLRRVYIDEAGDRGNSPGSSQHFVVAAIIVDNAQDARVRSELAALKPQIGRRPTDTLHFRKLNHSQRVKSCREFAQFSVQKITTVTICKHTLAQQPQKGGYIQRSDPMYLYAIRLLLERVSWYIRDTGGGSSIVTFAHLTRFPAHKLHDYREAMEHSNTKLHWPSFNGHQFRLGHPNTVDLLQLADVGASALFKCIEVDQYGVKEPRYLEELKPIIYRRGKVTTYGLKGFPHNATKTGGCLAALQAF